MLQEYDAPQRISTTRKSRKQHDSDYHQQGGRTPYAGNRAVIGAGRASLPVETGGSVRRLRIGVAGPMLPGGYTPEQAAGTTDKY